MPGRLSRKCWQIDRSSTEGTGVEVSMEVSSV